MNPHDFFKGAFLVIATGGWWNAKEVVAAMGGREIEVPDAHTKLYYAAKQRKYFLMRGGYGKKEFAVTPECIIPEGITAGEFVKAATGKDAR